MYLAETKAIFVEALQMVFDLEYPVADLREVLVGIEYPVDQQYYPSIWVDFDETAPLKRAGIGHVETEVGSGTYRTYTRWRFEGNISFTCVALSSLVRDRIYDEMVRIIAFGPEHPALAQFRSHIESNDLVAINANFDTIAVRANAAAPGTPWGTTEIIYERGIGIDIIGEFVSDVVTGAIASVTLLTAIDITDVVEYIGDVPPVPPVQGSTITAWH